jgi:hypothetical protein
MNRIFVFILFLMATQLASAQTQFVKYKKYLIPVGGNGKVVTGNFSSVTNTTVSLELLLERGEEDTFVWFEVETSNQLQCDDPGMSPYAAEIDEGDTYGATVNNLIADTQYFYRACSIDESGDVSSGSVRGFRTTNGIIVSTESASAVTRESAVLNGRITGGRNILVWLISGSSSSQVCGAPTSNATTASAVNSFSVNTINLQPALRYYYRACALNQTTNARSSGAVKNFITSDASTEARTIPEPESIGSDFVQIQGEVVSGTSVVAEFVIDDVANIQCPARLVRTSTRYNTGDIVSKRFTRKTTDNEFLLSNTKYFYRFCAENITAETKSAGEIQSFITTGDGISFTSISNRTDEGAQFNGELARAGRSKSTWFVIREGGVTLSDASCSPTLGRLGEKILMTQGETNQFTVDTLDDNKTYSVGFCSEGIGTDSGDISLGGQRKFNTKRNLSTFIETSCGASFSSIDGPLDVRLTQTAPSGFDSSSVTFENRGSGSVRMDVIEATVNSAGMESSVASWERIKGIIGVQRPFGTNVLRYRVKVRDVPSSGRWDITLACTSVNCLNVSNSRCALTRSNISQ